jgi:hypothetical protein
VRLEASTKSPIHNLIHEFFIIMAFTMACPNFKKGLKMAFGPLGVKANVLIFFGEAGVELGAEAVYQPVTFWLINCLLPDFKLKFDVTFFVSFEKFLSSRENFLCIYRQNNQKVLYRN